jgi:hypothetical protein
MCFHPTSVDMDAEKTLDQVAKPNNIFGWLHDVIVHMMLFLDFKTLGRAARVSKTWRKCFDDERLWKSLCSQIVEEEELLSLKEDSWKTLFLRLTVTYYYRSLFTNPESGSRCLFRSIRTVFKL